MSFPVDFVCVGDEGETEQWDNVRLSFVRMVQETEAMARIYQEADLLLHPSRADTAPFVVLEGMSSGLPVVATAVGGIPEQVEDQGSGFLVVPGDVEAMVDRIQVLLTKDSLRLAMGDRGREIALERFSLVRQVDAYLDWYREILDRCVSSAER
jgi:glycosyltransferase involved in cell wall biosynthesis